MLFYPSHLRSIICVLHCHVFGADDYKSCIKRYMLKIYSSIPLKKTAFCLKSSHFINKYDPPRSQLCQWPRLVHNCNQSFNMSQTSVHFLLIPATHGLHYDFQYNILYNMTFKYSIHNKYFNFQLNTLTCITSEYSFPCHG